MIRSSSLAALAAVLLMIALVLPIPAGLSEEASYALPKGLRLKSLPKAARLESRFGSYRRTYTLEKGTLKVKRELKKAAKEAA